MSAEQLEHFQNELEIDFAISEPGVGRFRAAVFYQRGFPAMVLRYISVDTPKLDAARPARTRCVDLAMLKRGLVLMVGATGSGKSTTLAAMINHRNENSSDHILTIEDPVEFLHQNRKAIVNQREVGLDTRSFSRALRARDARGAGRDPDRRDPRPRDDGVGDRARRHRPPLPSRRCTRTTAPRRWTASSTCSRATSTRRSSSTCRSTCARSSRSAWCAAATTSASRRSR